MGKKDKKVKEAKEEPEEEEVEAPVEPTTGEDKFVYPNGADTYEGGWILADDGVSRRACGRGGGGVGASRGVRGSGAARASLPPRRRSGRAEF